MVSVSIPDIKLPDRLIDDICHDIMHEMLEEGVKQAQATVGHVDTGETLNSIHYEQTGNEGEIIAEGAAIWLEFGTGVIKNPVPHPNQSEVHAHGTYGNHHGSDPNGWWYPSDKGWWTPKDGKYAGQPMAFTKGIAQTRFMYNTAHYLANNIDKIVKKALK